MSERVLCIPATSQVTSTVALENGLAGANFEDVVRANQRRIYRLLLALVRDPDTADNLTQECFLRAYQKRASFRGEASVSTWLTRIAINLARDHGRNRRAGFWRKVFHSSDENSQLAAQQVPDRSSSPERVLLAREAMQAVLEEVGTLPPQQREAFVLRFVEELSLEEIAGVMQRDVGTVKTHLFRAVQRVRKAVKETGR